jgi:hypothetical protein
VQLVVSRKVTPAEKPVAAAATPPKPGHPAAPSRSKAGGAAATLSHILLFTSDVMRSVRFYRTRWACACRITPRHHRLPATARTRATIT